MADALSARKRRVSFAGLLAASYILSALVLGCWVIGLGVIDLGPVGGWLFWPIQIAWLASVILAFALFRWRGAWTLLGLLFVLPGPAILGLLFYACAVNGQCV